MHCDSWTFYDSTIWHAMFVFKHEAMLYVDNYENAKYAPKYTTTLSNESAYGDEVWWINGNKKIQGFKFNKTVTEFIWSKFNKYHNQSVINNIGT